MKVLVTGNLGFIGHYITKALLEAKCSVVGVDRIQRAISLKDDRVTIQKGWKLRQIDCDLTNLERVMALIRTERPDAIVHMAAQYSVKYTTESCVRYVQNNLVAFTWLMEAAKVLNIRRFIYASSCAVSDERKPSGLYGATKAYNEECAHAYAHRTPGLTAIGLRFGPTYGPLCRRDQPTYIALRQYLDRGPISWCALFDRFMPYVYVADAASTVVKLLALTRALEPGHYVFPVEARDRPASIANMVTEAASYTAGAPPQWPKQHAEKPRPLYQADASVLSSILGWVPSMPMEEGVHNMIDWMRA
jgi:UDP-glucuronate 4-epimerase